MILKKHLSALILLWYSGKTLMGWIFESWLERNVIAINDRSDVKDWPPILKPLMTRVEFCR